jgi:O-antigen ligase
VIRGFGLLLIVIGAAVVAMDPSRIPAIDWVGKSLFGLGAFVLGAHGIPRLPARLRGPELLLPVGLIGWIWVAAVVAGTGRHLLAAVELTVPVALMLLIAVQRWNDVQWRVLALGGCAILAGVIATGLIQFSTVLNYGAFAHPNGFGGTMLYLAVFPVLCVERGSLLTRALGALTLLAFLPMVVFSSSRGSLAATLVFLGLWGFLRAGRLARWGLVAASAGLLAAGVSVIAGLATSELNAVSIDLFGKNLDTGRLGMWALLLQLSVRSPIFGYGPGGSFSAFNDGLSAHSVYFQTLFDAGIPGLILLLGSALAGAGTILRAFRLDRDDRVIRVGLAFLAALLIHGLIEVSWFGNFLPGTFIFWTLTGLLLSRTRDTIRA